MNSAATMELEAGSYPRTQTYMLDWEHDIRMSPRGYPARKRALVRKIVREARQARQESTRTSLWARLARR